MCDDKQNELKETSTANTGSETERDQQLETAEVEMNCSLDNAEIDDDS